MQHDFADDYPIMTFIIFFLAGLLSWFVATVTAGGAGVIYLALVSAFVSVPLATVTLGIAGVLTGAYRAWIYRNDCNQEILRWLLPGTIFGSILGASLFGVIIASQQLNAIQGLLAFFLIGSGISGLCNFKVYGKNPRIFLFFPMGLFTGFVSGLVGAAGPMINGLFQSFDLKPQQIVGTKSLNIFAQQGLKSLIYILGLSLSGQEAVLDASLATKDVVVFSIIAAVGGTIGVYAARKTLGKIHNEFFNTMLNIMMVCYGLHLAYEIFPWVVTVAASAP